MAEYPTAKIALEEWYHEFKRFDFNNFNELKSTYGSASLVGDNRVIFNIKGNDFRLIIKINFKAKAAFILWFGTHKEYDKIDASKIELKR